MRCELYAPKADIVEHCRYTRLIRTPPVRWIVGQFRIWIEDHRWPRIVRSIQVSLDDQSLPNERTDSLQRMERMTKVVQDPAEQHDIEMADRRDRQVRDIKIADLNSRSSSRLQGDH